MTPQKIKEHRIGVRQQFSRDASACDFDKMLAQGSDLNIQGRYADIEELGNDI